MISLRRTATTAVDDKRRATRHAADRAPRRERLRHAAEEIEADLARWIDVARNRAGCEQSLDLGGKAADPAVVAIIEWFDPVRIARQHYDALPRVPKRECKHSA